MSVEGLVSGGGGEKFHKKENSLLSINIQDYMFKVIQIITINDIY